MRSKRAVLLLLSSPFLLGFSFLADLKNEKANGLYKKGQVGKAKTEYLSAAKSDPKSPEIAYNLGNALYKEGAFKESLKAYQTGARGAGDPGFLSKAFYNLGNSLYRNQDLPKAVEFYKQALRLNPRDEDAKYNLELLLKKMPPQDPDKQKDQQKQDQQKDQDQKKDKEGQGGGSGGGGSEDQKSEGSQGGENKDEKSSEEEKPSGEGQEKEGESGQEEQGEGQEQKEEPQKGSGEQEEQNASQGESEQEKPAKPEEGQGASGGQGEEQEKEPAEAEGQAQPKTEADIRAEQILAALENQERQVLKFQNSPENPRMRGRPTAEKDW